MEFRTPSIEPEESDNPSVTFHDSHGRVMEKIYNMFPDKFQVDDNKWLTEAHKLFGFKSSTPRFIIDPVLFHGSYLDTPVWLNEEPNTGIFPFSTRFPRGIIPYRHGYRMKPPGRPFDIVFKDPIIKTFLGAPKLGVVTLDDAVFHTRQVVKLTSDLSASCDLYMRQKPY